MQTTELQTSMAENSNADEILHDLAPFVRQFKDLRVERLMPSIFVPAGVDPDTTVRSRDVVLVPEINLSARLYLPNDAVPGKKLPLLLYFHGGAFVVQSAFSSYYHTHLNLLVAEANVVAISVEYRLAPEHPLPAAYEDSWPAVKWLASSEFASDEWISDYADLNRVFIAGDSAGGNIAHYVTLRAGIEKLAGFHIAGAYLNCPFFLGEDPLGTEEHHPVIPKSFCDEMCNFVWAGAVTLDDPRVNPAKDPNLSSFPAKRVLVYTAEKDFMRDRSFFYKDSLVKSGWEGEIEVAEVGGEGHCFCITSPHSDDSKALIKKVAEFIQK